MSDGKRPLHVIDALDDAAERTPDGVFLTGARTMTLRELAAASHSVAAWLLAAGCKPGERVLIAAANHADVIVAALAAARCGVTFAILHESIRPAAFRDIATQVEPSCLVLDAGTAHLRGHAPDVPLLVAGDAALAARTSIGSIGAAAGHRVGTVRTDPVCLIFTSGSRGAPRGVMVSHDNVAFTTAAIVARLRYAAGDTIGLFLPLSFDYALYQVFLALASGASLHVADAGAVPLGLIDVLHANDVTVLPGVPLLFSALVAMLERRPQSLARLRAVTNTGERLPSETLARLTRVLPHSDVFLMYGLTECKRVSILMPDERRQRPESVGQVLDGTSAEIIGDDGRPVPDGASGELVVRGPHVTLGYWRAPDESAVRFRQTAAGDRALRTGDICRRDLDGYLYFEGRRDDQRKRRGFRISLLEIEAIAATVPGVADAAAVQASDGDELHLFVTSPVAGLTQDSVLAILRDRLEPHKIPDEIHVTPAMPSTPHGKVDRDALNAVAGNA